MTKTLDFDDEELQYLTIGLTWLIAQSRECLKQDDVIKMTALRTRIRDKLAEIPTPNLYAQIASWQERELALDAQSKAEADREQPITDWSVPTLGGPKDKL